MAGSIDRPDVARPRRREASGGGRSGQGGNRTPDTVIFSHVLYQLSYLADSGEKLPQPGRPGQAAPAQRAPNRSPMIPMTIRAIETNRSGARDSPSSTIPRMAVPTAPIPVQTA